MRVLVTGMTGLVGHALGQHLVRAGHTVVGLSRHPQQAQLAFPVELYPWDGLAGQISGAALRDLDAVIHLSGESIAGRRWSAEQKQRIRDSRVLSTQTLIQQLQRVQSKLKVFISASAIGYYGDRHDEPLNEAATPGQGFLADVCAEWEQASHSARQIADRQVCLRTGVVLAARGGALDRLRPLFMAGLGGRLGRGEQWLSWIHLEDLARLYVWALSEPLLQGAVNATAPYPVTNHQFTSVLGEVLHKPTVLAVPKVALQIAMGEMSAVILGSQRVLPEIAVRQGFAFHYPQLREALEETCAAQMKGHNEFVAEQWLAHPLPKVFEFFSQETNLEALTPPFLHFKVLGKSTAQIEEGTLIDYSLRLHGMPLRWQSRIVTWTPPHRFVDLQMKGPYSQWRHTHTFEELGGGTLLRDRVLYRIPGGLLGRLAAGRKVAHDIEAIFAYRRKQVGVMF